jgi:NAD(P)-dependent dehydrogenase (short-subunit alcohol dehydrogenase family)
MTRMTTATSHRFVRPLFAGLACVAVVAAGCSSAASPAPSLAPKASSSAATIASPTLAPSASPTPPASPSPTPAPTPPPSPTPLPVVGLAPEFQMSVYGATKAFVLFLSQGMSLELSPKGVYVQAVLPAATYTEFSGRSAS